MSEAICGASPGCRCAHPGYSTKTLTSGIVLAACFARVIEITAPRKTEGAGKAGRWPHPQAGVQAVVRVVRTPVSPQVWPERPAFPARWCYGLYVLSPARRACWPPSPAIAHELDPSVGGSGPHDFAVRSDAHRLGASKASIASRSLRLWRSRETPLLWIRMGAG
jgi:hypothetical protein